MIYLKKGLNQMPPQKKTCISKTLRGGKKELRYTSKPIQTRSGRPHDDSTECAPTAASQEYFDSRSTEELAQVIEELHLSSKEQVRNSIYIVYVHIHIHMYFYRTAAPGSAVFFRFFSFAIGCNRPRFYYINCTPTACHSILTIHV